MSCRGTIAALLLCAAAGSSFAEPTSIGDGTFELPAGYTETNGGMFAGKIETFRQNNARATTDARMYVSPDEAVVLFTSGMVYRDGMVSSLAELATVDQLMTKELAGKNPGKLASSSQRREGAILVSDVTYALDGRSEVFHNLACVDSKHALHMASLMCVGPDDQLGACLAAQRSLKLVVPDAVSFLDEPPPAAIPGVSGKPWSFVLPAGYTELDERSQKGQEKLRADWHTESVDFHMYETSTHLRRIVVMGLVTRSDHPPTWSDLESLENAAIAAPQGQSTKHLSRSMQRKGALLIGSQGDVLADDVRKYDSRMYGVDAKNRIYAFSIFCMGVGMESAECANVTQTMRLDIPDQVTPAPGEEPRRVLNADSSWKYLLAAIVLSASLALAFAIRLVGRKRRHRRR